MEQRSSLVSRERALAVTTIVGFALATAFAAHVAVPLPGTPVPMTLQPLAVVLAGLWLGPRVGAASILLYLTLGAVGAPVFAPVGPPGVARLIGPTGGYLLAMPVAAWIAGTVAARWPGFAGRAIAATAALAAIHAGGVVHLAAITGSFATAATLGTLPFLLGDVAKILVAAAISSKRGFSTLG